MSASTDWADGSATAVRKRVQSAGVSDRKCRLFCVACCRASEKLIRLLDLVEAWADDPGREKEVTRGRRAVGRWAKGIQDAVRSERDFLARWSVYCAADRKVVPPNPWFLQPLRFRSILREIVGPRLPPLGTPLAGCSTDAVGVASAIYAERAFDQLPILADALEDSGCNDASILSHLRLPGTHVRGCWALDLVLGKG
jgi:hypothetical protein